MKMANAEDVTRNFQNNETCEGVLCTDNTYEYSYAFESRGELIRQFDRDTAGTTAPFSFVRRLSFDRSNRYAIL